MSTYSVYTHFAGSSSFPPALSGSYRSSLLAGDSTHPFKEGLKNEGLNIPKETDIQISKGEEYKKNNSAPQRAPIFKSNHILFL